MKSISFTGSHSRTMQVFVVHTTGLVLLHIKMEQCQFDFKCPIIIKSNETRHYDDK